MRAVDSIVGCVAQRPHYGAAHATVHPRELEAATSRPEPPPLPEEHVRRALGALASAGIAIDSVSLSRPVPAPLLERIATLHPCQADGDLAAAPLPGRPTAYNIDLSARLILCRGRCALGRPLRARACVTASGRC